MMFGRFNGSGYSGNGYGGSMMNFVPHLLGAFLCLVVLTLVIILIVVAVRRSSHHHLGCCATSEQMGHMGYHGYEHSDSVVSSIVILNERYAKGEITDKDYARMKGELLK